MRRDGEGSRRASKLETLRREVAVGLEELERGDAIPADQVFEEILTELKTRSSKEKSP